MNKIAKHIFIGATVVALTACGGGGGSGGDSNNTGTHTGGSTGGGTNTGSTNSHEFGANTTGIAQYGLVQNADVYIKKINPDTGKVGNILWQEKTTGGDINHAGHFNTHSSEMEDKSYYSIAIDNGSDIDINLDGKAEEPAKLAVDTRDTFHIIVRGEWIKNMKTPLMVTPLSEYAYLKAGGKYGYFLSVNYTDLKDNLNKIAQEIIVSDVNGDDIIDIMDVLTFNAVTDKSKAYAPMFEIIKPNMDNWYRNEATFPLTTKYDYKKVGATNVGCKDVIATYHGNSNVVYCGNPLKAIDVSDPYDMSIISESNINLENEDPLIYGGFFPFVTKDGHYLIGREKGANNIVAVDISDKNNLKIVERLSAKNYSNFSYSMKKELMIAGDGDNGTYDIIDFSNPKDIKIISTVQTLKNSLSMGMTNDNIMYFTHYYGEKHDIKVERFNMVNPRQPERKGKFDIHHGIQMFFLKGYEWSDYFMSDYTQNYHFKLSGAGAIYSYERYKK